MNNPGQHPREPATPPGGGYRQEQQHPHQVEPPREPEAPQEPGGVHPPGPGRPADRRPSLPHPQPEPEQVHEPGRHQHPDQAGEGGEGGKHQRPEPPEPARRPTETTSVLTEAQSEEFGTRWDAVQTAFVDDPRQAVEQADGLVGDVLGEISRVFRQQRADLEQRWADDVESTEDLRVALQRYREFFQRLLSI